VELPDKKFSVKEIIIAQTPYYLRLETLSPLGQPQFIAATDGGELFLFYPSENKFYVGAASRRNLSLFIPLNLSLDTVVSLIMGRVPLIEYDDEQMVCEVQGDFYVLKLSGREGEQTQVLQLHRDQKELKTESYEEGGKLLFTTQYGSYERIGDVRFPREISITVPQDGTKVQVRYKSVELLSQIDSEKFMLAPPQGAEVLTLE
jgi:outer membrane lipoprotein-sorting protein